MRFADCVRGSIVLCDGAWGTEFQRLGARFGECIDAWNLTKPGFVRRVAESYVEAGSRVILTNTFRANPASLAEFDLQGQCDAINRAGVKISRQAAGTSALVFASLGPIEQRQADGHDARERLHEVFSQQAKALASEGPDALLIETMSDLNQARISAAAALETGLPVVVSFFFNSAANQAPASPTPEQVAGTLTSDGVYGIGANCGFGVREFIPLCSRLAAASPLPIWMKPNAGLPEIVDGRARYPISAAEFAQSARELAEAGATFLGGCCGTTPEYIRALAQQAIFKNS